MLDQFGLQDKRRTDILKLSGGMKRRLMIAKAFVTDPKILILDEPTAGVDVELRLELWDFLREINKKGITILLTTHYLEEAEKLCNHIAIISQGKIVALDETKNLKRKYSRDHIIVETETPVKLSALPKELLGFDPKISKSMMQFTCRNCTPIIGQILQLLENSGIKIARLNITEDTLESIYLELTTQNTSGVEA